MDAVFILLIVVAVTASLGIIGFLAGWGRSRRVDVEPRLEDVRHDEGQPADHLTVSNESAAEPIGAAPTQAGRP